MGAALVTRTNSYAKIVFAFQTDGYVTEIMIVGITVMRLLIFVEV